MSLLRSVGTPSRQAKVGCFATFTEVMGTQTLNY